MKINLKKIIGLKNLFLIFALLIFSPSANIFAQNTNSQPTVAAAPPRLPTVSENYQNADKILTEKSIAVDAKVNISLCVLEGDVKINGWDRAEIRALVEGGNDVSFSIREINEQSGKPNLIGILGVKNDKSQSDGCLSGNEIELDVPRGATVNITGQENNISIASINKTTVRNSSGNVSLDDIAQGIDVRNYDGDIIVGKSGGMITLNNTNGNIIIFETQGRDVGDALTAKTSSGSVIMQQVSQKQINAVSITGSIKFSGKFENGGQYSFDSTSGAINLEIPADSSCRIEAFYGGSFQSDLPLKNLTTDVAPSVKKIVSVIGAGGANLSLRNLSGAIRIKKK